MSKRKKGARRATGRGRKRSFTAPVAKPTSVPDADKLPAVIREHHQEMRFLRGDIAIDPKAADPDRAGKPISRARVQPSFARLSISFEQKKAAQTYAEQCEIEGGAAMGSSGHSDHVAPWLRSPTDRAVKAATKLRRMRAIWGPRARRLVDMLVLDNMLLGEISAALGQNDQRSLGEIVAALERCAQEWGIARRPRSIAEPRYRAPAARPKAAARE